MPDRGDHGVVSSNDLVPREGRRAAYSRLRPSHAPWFAQMRAELRAAVGWPHPGLVPLDLLDDYWERQVQAPPAEDEVERLIHWVEVELGNHLVARGFEWCISSDEWGTAFGVIALRETAELLVVPESFVLKRWDGRERRFLEDGGHALEQHVSEVRTAWERQRQ